MSSPSGTAQFSKGQKLLIDWSGSEYQAEVVSVAGQRICIHYEGWSSSWDEWLTLPADKNRILKQMGAQNSSEQEPEVSAAPNGKFVIGQQVRIDDKYTADVIAVDGSHVKIKYRNWPSDTHDAWVKDLTRLQPGPKPVQQTADGRFAPNMCVYLKRDGKFEPAVIRCMLEDGTIVSNTSLSNHTVTLKLPQDSDKIHRHSEVTEGQLRALQGKRDVPIKLLNDADLELNRKFDELFHGVKLPMTGNVMTFYDKHGRLPSYHEVSHDFNGDFSKVRVISHPWWTREHPDPDGDQMEIILNFMHGSDWRNEYNSPSDLYYTFVFYDYISLPQHPRTEEQTEVFRRCLGNMDLLYANFPVFYTTKVLSTGDHIEPYMKRSWCKFEYAVHKLNASCDLAEDRNFVADDGDGLWRLQPCHTLPLVRLKPGPMLDAYRQTLLSWVFDDTTVTNKKDQGVIRKMFIRECEKVAKKILSLKPLTCWQMFDDSATEYPDFIEGETGYETDQGMWEMSTHSAEYDLESFRSEYGVQVDYSHVEKLQPCIPVVNDSEEPLEVYFGKYVTLQPGEQYEMPRAKSFFCKDTYYYVPVSVLYRQPVPLHKLMALQRRPEHSFSQAVPWEDLAQHMAPGVTPPSPAPVDEFKVGNECRARSCLGGSFEDAFVLKVIPSAVQLQYVESKETCWIVLPDHRDAVLTSQEQKEVLNGPPVHKFQVGQEVEVDASWYAAKVTAVEPTRVKIKYEGWPADSYDKWITLPQEAELIRARPTKVQTTPDGKWHVGDMVKLKDPWYGTYYKAKIAEIRSDGSVTVEASGKGDATIKYPDKSNALYREDELIEEEANANLPEDAVRIKVLHTAEEKAAVGHFRQQLGDTVRLPMLGHVLRFVKEHQRLPLYTEVQHEFNGDLSLVNVVLQPWSQESAVVPGTKDTVYSTLEMVCDGSSVDSILEQPSAMAKHFYAFVYHPLFSLPPDTASDERRRVEELLASHFRTLYDKSLPESAPAAWTMLAYLHYRWNDCQSFGHSVPAVVDCVRADDVWRIGLRHAVTLFRLRGTSYYEDYEKCMIEFLFGKQPSALLRRSFIDMTLRTVRRHFALERPVRRLQEGLRDDYPDFLNIETKYEAYYGLYFGEMGTGPVGERFRTDMGFDHWNYFYDDIELHIPLLNDTDHDITIDANGLVTVKPGKTYLLRRDSDALTMHFLFQSQYVYVPYMVSYQKPIPLSKLIRHELQIDP